MPDQPPKKRPRPPPTAELPRTAASGPGGDGDDEKDDTDVFSQARQLREAPLGRDYEDDENELMEEDDPEVDDYKLDAKAERQAKKICEEQKSHLEANSLKAYKHWANVFAQLMKTRNCEANGWRLKGILPPNICLRDNNF